VVKNIKTHKGTCSGGFSKPDKGMYLIADVVIEGKKGETSVNSLNFTFVGDDGATANTASGLFSGCEKNNLDATNELRPGQKRAGQIVFDVAQAKGAIEYGAGAFGSDTAGSWEGRLMRVLRRR
jgi:hypothetical protein